MYFCRCSEVGGFWITIYIMVYFFRNQRCRQKLSLLNVLILWQWERRASDVCYLRVWKQLSYLYDICCKFNCRLLSLVLWKCLVNTNKDASLKFRLQEERMLDNAIQRYWKLVVERLYHSVPYLGGYWQLKWTGMPSGGIKWSWRE